ncbi:hypothetical protein [Teredinibacter haidensis]|uniref:hypothetical protein n=1 Tax=Teredinibacter haidensis TaxID=2731755 RepID=UPI000948DA9E|nr:hypothetical protein [Teredinibacter haidensis]
MDQQHNRDPSGRKTTNRITDLAALAPALLKKKRAEHVSVSDMQSLSRAGEIPNSKQSPIKLQ